MQITVHTTRQQLLHGIKIALQSRLYVSGWYLSQDLIAARKHLASPAGIKPANYWLALAYVEQIPLGVLFVTPDLGNNRYHVFVRKAARRQGVGSALVERLHDAFPSHTFVSSDGCEGYIDFLAANGYTHDRNPDEWGSGLFRCGSKGASPLRPEECLGSTPQTQP
jgi:GNAT superfamily N-acetyltransferase